MFTAVLGLVLVSSGEEITSLIALTHPTPQVLETLFYTPATLPHLTFSQMLTKQTLCFDSFQRAQLQKV